MDQDDNRSTQVLLKGLDPDKRERAVKAARDLGFSSLAMWLRHKVYELAGDA